MYSGRIASELHVYISAAVKLRTGCAHNLGQHWKLENVGGWVLDESFARYMRVLSRMLGRGEVQFG